jgi:hypothetical protein
LQAAFKKMRVSGKKLRMGVVEKMGDPELVPSMQVS